MLNFTQPKSKTLILHEWTNFNHFRRISRDAQTDKYFPKGRFDFWKKKKINILASRLSTAYPKIENLERYIISKRARNFFGIRLSAGLENYKPETHVDAARVVEREGEGAVNQAEAGGSRKLEADVAPGQS